jgi:1-acylglycerone phosphate reductase
MSQKSVLITGTSEGGIGDALALAFKERGLRVFASARNLDKVQHLADKGFDIVKLDVLDQDSIAEAVKFIKKATGGKLDYLVNNSGSGRYVSLTKNVLLMIAI